MHVRKQDKAYCELYCYREEKKKKRGKRGIKFRGGMKTGKLGKGNDFSGTC